MIGYLPEIYPDELIYSWLARYYAHNGYTCYSSALSDLLKSKIQRVDIEFTAPLNDNAKTAIGKMYDYQQLILDHTMYPYYARFANHEKQQKALIQLVNGYGQIHNTVTFANCTDDRYLCYCPECSTQDRETFGETYFHRVHQIRHIGVCPKHKCKLMTTDIKISSASSPRLYVPDAIIPQDLPPTESVNGLELEFAAYQAELFEAPLSISRETDIGAYLSSMVDCTEYSPKSGRCRYTTKLTKDLATYYHTDTYSIPHNHLQRILKGHNNDFREICLLAYFLGIPINDLADPKAPMESKAVHYQRKVRELYKQGLGCKRISSLLGSDDSTVLKVKHSKAPKPHNHNTRQGMQTQDWSKLDRESLPLVETAIATIKGDGTNRPGRITERSILRAMDWPSKRLDYLPLCKELVRANMEPIELFWAREVIWAYNKLKQELGQKQIYWRYIRDITNIDRLQFEKTWPLLSQVTNEITANQIKNL